MRYLQWHVSSLSNSIRVTPTVKWIDVKTGIEDAISPQARPIWMRDALASARMPGK